VGISFEIYKIVEEEENYRGAGRNFLRRDKILVLYKKTC